MNTSTSCAACTGAATVCPRPLQVATFTLEVTAHVSDASHRTSSMYTKFEVPRPSSPEDMTDSRSRPWHLTLWPLVEVTGHPALSLASFLPIISLLCPSVFDLASGMGQTDRRTGRLRPSMHYVPPCWGGTWSANALHSMWDNINHNIGNNEMEFGIVSAWDERWKTHVTILVQCSLKG